MTATVTDDPLRPTVCPRCEYALDGLPADGVCPECGRAYGPPEVWLYGYGVPGFGRTPRKVIRRSAVRRGLVLMWVITLGSLGFQAWLLSGLHTPLLMRLWIGACLLFPLVIATWRSMADNGSGGTQVRLGPDGVRQVMRGLGTVPYERADRARLTPWHRIGQASVRPAGEGQMRITLSLSAQWWRWRRDCVSAIVWCSPAAAASLQQRIAEWRGVVEPPI